jgi:hypothetical protein
MKRAAWLTAALFAIAIPCAADSTVPHTIFAGYDMFRNGMHIAVMSETFEARDGDYRITRDSEAVGLAALFLREPLRVVSSGRLTAAGLQPRFFEGKRNETDPRRARADFDWPAQQLTLTRDGRTDTLNLPPATQDLLSTMYQFMFLELEKLQHFELSMTNGRKLDHYLYTINRDVEIDTPIGRMTTVHLVKQHRPDESSTEIWVAPQHRNLPVKMLILEGDGSRYEQIITKLEIAGS